MTQSGHLAMFTAPPGRRDDLQAILEPQLSLVPDEPATLLYLFTTSVDAPGAIWSYERYTDEAGFHAHGHAPGVMDGLMELDGLQMAAQHLDLAGTGKGVPATEGVSKMADAERLARTCGRIAHLDCKPGTRDEVLALVGPAVEQAMSEQGTEIYLWHTVRDEPDTLCFYGIFSNEAALNGHFHSEPAVTLQASIEPFLVSAATFPIRVLAGKWI